MQDSGVVLSVHGCDPAWQPVGLRFSVGSRSPSGARGRFDEVAEVDTVVRQGHGVENQVAKQQDGENQVAENQVADDQAAESQVATNDVRVDRDGRVHGSAIAPPVLATMCGLSGFRTGPKNHTSPLAISGWSAMSC